MELENLSHRIYMSLMNNMCKRLEDDLYNYASIIINIGKREIEIEVDGDNIEISIYGNSKFEESDRFPRFIEFVKGNVPTWDSAREQNYEN